MYTFCSAFFIRWADNYISDDYDCLRRTIEHTLDKENHKTKMC